MYIDIILILIDFLNIIHYYIPIQSDNTYNINDGRVFILDTQNVQHHENSDGVMGEPFIFGGNHLSTSPPNGIAPPLQSRTPPLPNSTIQIQVPVGSQSQNRRASFDPQVLVPRISSPLFVGQAQEEPREVHDDFPEFENDFLEAQNDNQLAYNMFAADPENFQRQFAEETARHRHNAALGRRRRMRRVARELRRNVSFNGFQYVRSRRPSQDIPVNNPLRPRNQGHQLIYLRDRSPQTPRNSPRISRNNIRNHPFRHSQHLHHYQHSPRNLENNTVR